MTPLPSVWGLQERERDDLCIRSSTLPTCSSCYSSPPWSRLHLHPKCPPLRKSEPPAQQSSTTRQRSQCTSAETARGREREQHWFPGWGLLWNTSVKTEAKVLQPWLLLAGGFGGVNAQLSTTLLYIHSDLIYKDLVSSDLNIELLLSIRRSTLDD